MRSSRLALLALLSTLSAACSPGYHGIPPTVGPKDVAESILGERLFREPRFSKFFVRQTGGNPNAILVQGDPSLERLESPRRGNLHNPFAAQAMSCVACHMVDDAQSTARGGIRGYADFAVRSPIPTPDGSAHPSGATTPRNSPILLDAFIHRPEGTPFLLHYDGEFTTIEDLIIGGYTGRNFGWLPGEKSEALANLIRVIREDDGSDPLAAKFSNRFSYSTLLMGRNSAIASNTLLSPDARMDISRESDAAILSRVTSLIKTYLEALQFATDPVTGVYSATAYDAFLLTNNLPQKPDAGESPQQYAGRLAWAMQGLDKPTWVSVDSGQFGPLELEGARIFLATSRAPSEKRPGFFQVGNCVACHAPPHFTDFKMHNTGATQEEYDSLHGHGSFIAMHVPSLTERRANPDAYMPATEAHPLANSRFRSVPIAADPGLTDLGAWNIFANPDYPAPQAGLAQMFCPAGSCTDDVQTEAALDRSVATFKTPTLRGLALSDPYLHTGAKANLGQVIDFYREMSRLGRAGQLRNVDPEILSVDVDHSGAQALEAFLNSLNEEYE